MIVAFQRSGRGSLKLSKVVIILVALFVLSVATFNALPYMLLHLPAETWQLKKSDVIIVLGAAANKNGTPSPPMRERVDAGARLFKEGYASYLIVTGASAHNKYVEADVMAARAIEDSVPDDRIIREPKAKNTRQNAYNSYQIMRTHGWQSAIVVSQPEHLLRSNSIFSHYPINYCMYPADDPPETSFWDRLCFDQREKYFVISDIVCNKGLTMGLTPEQAANMGDLDKQAELLHRR